MAVVASEDGELVMQDPLTQDNSIVTGTGDEIDEEEEEEEMEMQDLKIEPTTPSKSSTQNSQNDPKLQKEMETCFGFDEVSSIYFLKGFKNYFLKQLYVYTYIYFALF